MKASANIFLRKDYKNKDNEYLVIMRVVIHSQKRDYGLNFSVKENFFDIEKKEIISKHPRSAVFNKIIRDNIKKAYDIIDKFNFSNDYLTLKEFDTLYITKEDNFKKNNLFEFWLKHLESKKSSITESHYKQHFYEISKMKAYKPNVLFSDINYKFFVDYEEYMRSKLNNKTNTVGKTFKKLKHVLKSAEIDGKTIDGSYKNYKIKSEKTDRECLNINEIKLLQNLFDNKELPSTHHNILRYFLFAQYAGLRYSDLKSLKYEHIQDNVIVKNMEKTKKNVRVPLVKKALELIEEKKESEYIFKVYTNQVTNRYLKEISLMAGIKKNLTFHVSRHTFATLLINSGMQTKIVSELMGHENIKTTEIYLHIADDIRKEAMNNFNDILEKQLSI